jgi:arylsulfatase/uncharacterized sulfatase
MKAPNIIHLLCLAALCFSVNAEELTYASTQSTPPNIVLILADDLAFTDLGAFGSEIKTPNIDQLAQAGIRFSNYHTAASCAPSRAMFLTGVGNHRNGVANIPEALLPEQKKHANYQGVLGHNVVTVATLLQQQGYHTYMSGKWHLGKTPDLLPYRRGFERTLAMMDTGADNWEQKPYLPIYEKAHWTADGKETTLQEDFYSSELIVDSIIGFIDQNKNTGQPFFAYLPFLAVHIPVQAPKEFTDKYLDTYIKGWHHLRESRYNSAKAIGLIPSSAALGPGHFSEDWDSLSEQDKRFSAKRMAVYAGMITAMDHHIGRLIDHLKASGSFANTIFIITSDNGPEAAEMGSIMIARQGYHTDYDSLGEKGSFNFIGQNFASAAASPLSLFKFYAGEGGLRVPLIISGKDIPQQAAFNSAFSYVTDITPTILQLTGTAPAGARYAGRPVEPITGKSLLPIINQYSEQVYQANEYVGYEVAGNKALFNGDLKIVFNRGPLGDSQWYLFNIKTDPGETEDLASSHPTQFQSMLNMYHEYALNNKVLAVNALYSQQGQVIKNSLRDIFSSQLIIIFLLFSILIGFYTFARSKRIL